jgi:alkylation response protein AidB-like acyl-CoA dehydrogenase
MDKHQNLLYLAESYLQESVSPHAAAIDSDSDALKNALIGLGEVVLLALRVPSQWGGLEVSKQTFHAFEELVARHSGALAFLQTQHQSAAAMLIQSENEFVKREYLP